jgi:hypothetical protein
MASIREQLLQTRGHVSPRGINDVIRSIRHDADTIFSMLPPEVRARVDRGSNPNRKNRFLRGIQELIEKGLTDMQIIKMDGECVDNRGRIDEKRLIGIINGEYDD